MAGFGADVLDDIRARVDIVELVGQFVNLKRAGENWKGLCPFHTERTPSFTVNPKRGIFHCFGCGAGGDAFRFLMRHDRLAFPEAVRALAERTGVVLAASREAEPEAAGKLEALRRVMALAAEFYSRSLWEAGGAKAREYLDTRGVDPEVARRFGLGYAPASWDALLSRMKAEGIGDDLLVQAGLVLPRQTGSGFYDRFRGRLLFPIRDTQGRVVAFGGRALAGEEPKYLNSPETPLYVKGQILYALDVARAAMRERGRAILVEGYLDCLMAHQHGFTETVAALGTAFTPAQLGLLRRHADEVIALFDADAAGQKAASRIEEMMTDGPDIQDLGWSVSRTGGFEKAGVFSVRVAVLPDRPRSGQPPARRRRRRAPRAARRRALAAVLRPRQGARRGRPRHAARPRRRACPRRAPAVEGVQCRGSDHALARGRPAPGRGRDPALDRGPTASGRPGAWSPSRARARGNGGDVDGGAWPAAQLRRARPAGPPLALRRRPGRAPRRPRRRGRGASRAPPAPHRAAARADWRHRRH